MSNTFLEPLEGRMMLSATAAPLPYTIGRQHAFLIQDSRHGMAVTVSTSGRHGRFLNVTIDGTAYRFSSTQIHQVIFTEHCRHDRCKVAVAVVMPCDVIASDGSDTLLNPPTAVDSVPADIPFSPTDSSPKTTEIPIPLPQCPTRRALVAMTVVLGSTTRVVATSSGSLHYNLRVEPPQFDPGVGRLELPVNLLDPFVPVRIPY